MTLKEIKENEEVKGFILRGDYNLERLGFTEHSVKHCTKVARTAEGILETLGYGEREIRLAGVAGYLHDIGNSINRSRHAEFGALLANQILEKTDMPFEDRLVIVSAIGHHDESTGGANDAVSAALIIADKTDVRRNRVRNKGKANFDIHDRVNYAVFHSELHIHAEQKAISLDLEIDEEICSMYEYFDIFLGRMMMCRKAAEILGCSFRLLSNGRKIL